MPTNRSMKVDAFTSSAPSTSFYDAPPPSSEPTPVKPTSSHTTPTKFRPALSQDDFNQGGKRNRATRTLRTAATRSTSSASAFASSASQPAVDCIASSSSGTSKRARIDPSEPLTTRSGRQLPSHQPSPAPSSSEDGDSDAEVANALTHESPRGRLVRQSLVSPLKGKGRGSSAMQYDRKGVPMSPDREPVMIYPSPSPPVSRRLCEEPQEEEDDASVVEEVEEECEEEVQEDFVHTLPTPISTPTKRARSHSPVPSRPSRSQRAASPPPAPVLAPELDGIDSTIPSHISDSEASPSDAEPASDAEPDSGSDDQSTPLTSPTKITPRSSARARGLPVDMSVLKGAPANLHAALLEHAQAWEKSDDEEEEEEAEEEEDEMEVEAECMASPSKGKGKERARLYESEDVLDLLSRVGRKLSGDVTVSADAAVEGAKGKGKGRAQGVKDAPYMVGYEKWERPLRYAMEGVVKEKVGNCLVVVGRRGVGKSLMIERSLKLLRDVYGEDGFVTVRLNGLVQTTDRLALRAIARQLKSNGFQEDDGDFGSTASTMSTLLSMLEPPTTPGEEVTENKPIIVVLDEFDLFAMHPRQSFLYCLLDIIQGNRRKSGMGVIGVSSRTDCVSTLEKRVRSRCQSQVHQVVLENSWDGYLALAKSLLEVEGEGKADYLAREWNAEVESFLESSKTKKYLDRLWKIHGNTPNHLIQAFTTMYSKLEWNAKHSTDAWDSPAPTELEAPKLDVSLLPQASEPRARDDLLSDRSVLELTVCIAAKYMRVEHDNTFNLEMLYDCYDQHVNRHKGQAVKINPYPKQSFAMALDAMRELEIFLPCSGRPSTYFTPSFGDSFRLFKFVPWASTLDVEIEARSDVPLPTKRWNKNWLA
ncbi:hypothetical protein MNV49_002625 [Pseudohyphozyma bogoriensis]|nr:hypothetical protein MNV49_002625 [Pseudohyphozyma bogoriensis]